MPATRYTQLPTQPSTEDDEATRELEDAFEDDDEDDQITPLHHILRRQQQHHQRQQSRTSLPPGTYDFERDRDYPYDLPPPGSPPLPSSRALPNDYGNSNGNIPTTPATGPLFSTVRSAGPSPSFFRRTVGSLLPSHYQLIPTTPASTGTVGGGVNNDGVFANVMAKPGRDRGDDGNIYLASEDARKDMPPSYAEAQTDNVPPYWETTVVAPSEIGAPGEMIVDDLPTGGILMFAFNLFTSFFFQFIGFVITYFLSTTHAAKFGSRAGLGLTFIQYGAYWRVATSGANGDGTAPGEIPQEMIWWNKTDHGWEPVVNGSVSVIESIINGTASAEEVVYDDDFGWNGKDWIALVFMTFGWLLLFSSIVGFWRVKRWEMSIRASHQARSPSSEDPANNRSLRRNLEDIFGFNSSRNYNPSGAAQEEPGPENGPGTPAGDTRLLTHLRAAGLM